MPKEGSRTLPSSFWFLISQWAQRVLNAAQGHTGRKGQGQDSSPQPWPPGGRGTRLEKLLPGGAAQPWDNRGLPFSAQVFSSPTWGVTSIKQAASKLCVLNFNGARRPLDSVCRGQGAYISFQIGSLRGRVGPSLPHCLLIGGWKVRWIDGVPAAILGHEVTLDVGPRKCFTTP